MFFTNKIEYGTTRDGIKQIWVKGNLLEIYTFNLKNEIRVAPLGTSGYLYEGPIEWTPKTMWGLLLNASRGAIAKHQIASGLGHFWDLVSYENACGPGWKFLKNEYKEMIRILKDLRKKL